MSLYKKALYFVWFTFILGFVVFPLVAIVFGAAFFNVGGLYIIFGIWLLLGVLSLLMLGCPKCGTSIYATPMGMLNLWRPWPNKYCAKCKRNHQLEQSKEE